jgi:phage/plasmid-like protein (TIGR03299 family)
MAHLIDNSKGFNAFVSYAKPAWHNLGTTFSEPVTTEQALNQGGLNFDVLKLPNIHYLPNGTELISPDSFFTVRTDVNKVLGSKLGKDYTVMQNIEALNIVDEILQSGTATIETCGAIDNGKKVFICLKVNKDILVSGNDIVNQYVLIATSHDGSLSITAMQTNIRVVCNNTLTAALQNAQDKIKIRHTSNAANRLGEAMRVLKLITTNTAANEDNYNKMKETIISQKTMFDYFGNVFFSNDEIKALQSGEQVKDVISKQKQKTIAGVLDFSQTGIGQSITMKGNDFTAWTAYNAITGYITHNKQFATNNDRANSMLFGSTADTIEYAGVLALEPAKIQSLAKLNFNNLNLN